MSKPMPIEKQGERLQEELPLPDMDELAPVDEFPFSPEMYEGSKEYLTATRKLTPFEIEYVKALFCTGEHKSAMRMFWPGVEEDKLGRWRYRLDNSRTKRLLVWFHNLYRSLEQRQILQQEEFTEEEGYRLVLAKFRELGRPGGDPKTFLQLFDRLLELREKGIGCEATSPKQGDEFLRELESKLGAGNGSV